MHSTEIAHSSTFPSSKGQQIKKITDIERRLALGESVPVSELSELGAFILSTLATYASSVKELIFLPNKRLTRAFGGKGNLGTRFYIKKINLALCARGFPRRMSLAQYEKRITELQRRISME